MKNSKVLYKLLITFFWVLAAAFLAVYGYTLITYGNTPVSEMPGWVAWLFFSPRWKG